MLLEQNKSIWEELNELPRDEQKEYASWTVIEKKMRKTNYLKGLLTGTITVAILSLLMILIGTNKQSVIPQQAVDNPSLQSIYFVNNTYFDDDFKVIPSSFYSFVHQISDPRLLNSFESYLTLMVQTDEIPEIYDLNKDYVTDISFVYSDGSEKKYKMLEPTLFYDLESKRWYSIDKIRLNSIDMDIHELWSSLRFTGGWWISALILVNSLILLISDKVIKHKYGIKRRIKYVENNFIARLCFYGLLILLLLFSFSMVRFNIIIHIFWFLMILFIIGSLIILLEIKFGSGKASLYSLIISSIMFVVVFTTLIYSI